MKRGAIILCGGKSSRMGYDKASLPFGPERMLPRVIRLVSQVVPLEECVVVASPGQVLPEISSVLRIVRDARPDRGPLEGLAAGLRAIGPQVEAVYVTSCDVPLLVPGFVERVFEKLEGYEIAVPCDGQHCHPLAAVYRTSILPHVLAMLAEGSLAPRMLFDRLRTWKIEIEEFRDVDPQLATLENLNSPAEYDSALVTAGFRQVVVLPAWNLEVAQQQQQQQ